MPVFNGIHRVRQSVELDSPSIKLYYEHKGTRVDEGVK